MSIWGYHCWKMPQSMHENESWQQLLMRKELVIDVIFWWSVEKYKAFWSYSLSPILLAAIKTTDHRLIPESRLSKNDVLIGLMSHIANQSTATNTVCLFTFTLWQNWKQWYLFGAKWRKSVCVCWGG
jgi:hypothetical protein